MWPNLTLVLEKNQSSFKSKSAVFILYCKQVCVQFKISASQFQMILSYLAISVLCQQALSSSSWHHEASLNGSEASVLWHHKKGFWIEPGQSPSKHRVGVATYQNAVNSTGWGFLELETSGKFSSMVQAYGAGYLEGWITSSLLYMQYQNTIVGRCEFEFE